MRVSEGGNKRPSPEESSPSNAAASSKSKVPRIAPQDDALVINTGNDFDHPAPPASSTDDMQMPKCINLHESGLRRSPRLQELAEQKTKQQAKAHVTWAKKLPPLVTLFTIYSLVSDFRVQMPSIPISPTASFSDRMISKIHEVNELYDGTLNAVVSYAFSTLDLDTSNNEVFTYTKALQQQDASQFVQAMRTEIEDHESRDHWDIVPCSLIPEGKKTIQAISSFKRKRFPDRSLN
jgi:hypothetical protein